MNTKVRTCLMFEGAAEEAMNFHVSLIDDSENLELRRYSEGEQAGKIQLGVFSLGAREHLCFDSPVKHDFDFSPAVSLFADFSSAERQRKVFDALADCG